MSTPVVAGAAVIARQYFMEGFYPTGRPTAANAFTPSGALIKAVLLGGAYAMDGFTERGMPLEPPPSFRQGFGRVQLNRALPLAGRLPADGWRLQVVDGAEIEEGETHSYCVQV